MSSLYPVIKSYVITLGAVVGIYFLAFGSYFVVTWTFNNIGVLWKYGLLAALVLFAWEVISTVVRKRYVG